MSIPHHLEESKENKDEQSCVGCRHRLSPQKTAPMPLPVLDVQSIVNWYIFTLCNRQYLWLHFASLQSYQELDSIFIIFVIDELINYGLLSSVFRHRLSVPGVFGVLLIPCSSMSDRIFLELEFFQQFYTLLFK